MTEQTGAELNPWSSIWFNPRQTMRSIRRGDPDDLVILLACFAGFSEVLISASRFNLGDHLPVLVIFALAVLSGPVIGMAGLIIGSSLFWWTGRWLDGMAKMEMLRAAIAWSFVPVICYSVLWIPKYLLLGDVLFVSRTVVFGSPAHLLIVGFNILRLVIGLWSFILFLNCLSEVQGFPLSKALVNTLLSLMLVVTAGLFIAAVIGVTIR